MPELPEVETVRRSLKPHLLGRRITRAFLRRPDILRGDASPAALLSRDRIERLERHGKQLALIGASGRVLVVHLGMSGQLLLSRHPSPDPEPSHTHAAWSLATDHRPPARLRFRDPRRFGGLTTLPDMDALRLEHWSSLGPDALTVRADRLRPNLAATRRPIKAALLDQSVLAGVGNLYADEALFHARICPRQPAASLNREEVSRLCRAIRSVLGRAIRAGGSTLSDGMYLDGEGKRGSFQLQHAAYGRSGLPCGRCKAVLRSEPLAQRTTVWCPVCQPERVDR